jgi:hypothetical protein
MSTSQSLRLLLFRTYTSFAGILAPLINDLSSICSVLEKISGLPVDLTVLSIEEEKGTEFLKRINSLYLKIKIGHADILC